MRQTEEVNRNDHPREAGNCLTIMKLKPQERRTVLVLSDRFQGYDLHWHLGTRRHVRCFKRLGIDACEGCQTHQPGDWLGFLVVTDLARSAQVLLQLTDFGGRQAECFLTQYGTLRGLVLSVCKDGTTKKAPTVLDFLEQVRDQKDLPHPRSVEPTLLRMWGPGKIG